MQLFLKKRRTITSVLTSEAARQERESGKQAALRSMAVVQLSAQLILWVTFFGYDKAAQAVWQAALMLFLPIIVLWSGWKNAKHGLALASARFLLLPLMLCLGLDAALLLSALGGFISQLTPQYPPWVGMMIPAVLCFLTVLWSGRRGVSYGLSLLKAPLMILFVFGTIFLRASSRADRLWPLLGQGLVSTASAALNGAGSTWSVALLFCLGHPLQSKKQPAGWILIPWLLCVMWALWYGFLKPWAPGDSLAIGEKMMGMARHASSVILYEVAGLLWMLLIPAALTACFSTAERLVSAALPKCPYMLALAVLPLAVCAFLLWQPEKALTAVEILGPYRALVSFFCAVGFLIAGRKAQ